LTGLETGRVIESGKLFSSISPPDETTIDIALDLEVTRTERKMGYFLLFHEVLDGKLPNFANNVEAGVMALGRTRPGRQFFDLDANAA